MTVFPAPPPAEPDDILPWFDAQMATLDDIVYGVALLFEGMHLLYAGQDALIETYRKQYRNLIQSGKAVSQRGTTLLEQARSQPGEAIALRDFDFTAFQAHPDPAGLIARAQALVATYARLFPDRPRSRELTEEETFRLIEDAADSFDAT